MGQDGGRQAGKEDRGPNLGPEAIELELLQKSATQWEHN